MMEIRRITGENVGDLKLPNDSFSMPGRMIPKLENGCWSYDIEWFEPAQEMRFPDEDYDLQQLEKENAVVLGAYENAVCIGLVVLKQSFFKYMYIYDLKVCAPYRKHGVGRALMEKAKQIAKEQGYQGLYLQAQDNNLAACLFYLNTGFEIGGFDNHVYNGTAQEGKADILFYTKREV